MHVTVRGDRLCLGDFHPPDKQLITRMDILDRLARIESPKRVPTGELNPVTPVAATQEIAQRLAPGIGRLEIKEGTFHVAWLDAPDGYRPVIIDLVTSCPPT